MSYAHANEVPKWLLALLNNMYEIERKIALYGDPGGINRNLQKMKDLLREDIYAEMTGLFYEDPMGQTFNETRTDLEVSISGSSTEDLVVIEVMKPIIRHGKPEYSRVVQRGIVIVQSKFEGENHE